MTHMTYSLLRVADSQVERSHNTKRRKSGIQGKYVLSLAGRCTACFPVASCYLGAHTCTDTHTHVREHLLWRLTMYSPLCSRTERQHLGPVPDHLPCIHAQQLAPGVHPLCAQIQGENAQSGNTFENVSAGTSGIPVSAVPI